MLDAPGISFKAHRAQPLAVEALVRGKSRAEVAELLPRLFNLCRSAQSLAVRRALDLNGADELDELRREIIRDHVLRLTVVLPGHFGYAPMALPAGWQDGGEALKSVLFGPARRLPDTMESFASYLQGGMGLAALWGKIAALFANGEAETGPLPYVSPATATDARARVENSCAIRVADHPVVRTLGEQGRNPLWRVVARSYDLQALLEGAPLNLEVPRPGVAHVPATRGLYAVCADHDGERVTAFLRVTPTDHLQANGGVLDQTLASLPATRASLLPLIMDILDPCAPIRIEETADA